MVEAGLYVTAGTKVRILGWPARPGSAADQVVKASELSGRSGMLLRRNSQTGAVEALARAGTSGAVELNAALHAN